MDILRTRRIIMNMLPYGGRPSKADIELVTAKLPDAKIHGFGKYGLFNTWYLLVQSSHFQPLDAIETVAYSSLPFVLMSRKVLFLVSENPGDGPKAG